MLKTIEVESDDWRRGQSTAGHWRCTRRPDAMVEVEYQLHLEPNGEVPSWLANSVVVDAPYQTLLRLRAEIMKPENAPATYQWLREKP
ncbi:hypothetical protein [Candidatus Thiodictyon syntrophicum]|jgi:hypothetical protein|uniref:hypothetical protein n=1 Tax=Candidatus Thiodictyon syntrophicum TaxID=1166950 RepID=UPI0012FD5791|nr:hypothetical protein [Candidatus Thiodictyon syntrophicum]